MNARCKRLSALPRRGNRESLNIPLKLRQQRLGHSDTVARADDLRVVAQLAYSGKKEVAVSQQALVKYEDRLVAGSATPRTRQS